MESAPRRRISIGVYGFSSTLFKVQYTAQAQARAVENRVHLIKSKFGRAMPSRRFVARTAAHVHCPGAGTQLATGIRDVERDAASTAL